MFTSAKDLIARKSEINERKGERLNVTIKGLGDWCFRVPSVEEVMDAQEYGRVHNGASESGDTYLLYNQCEAPDLRDMELQAAYGANGCNVLHKLLKPGEVEELAQMLMMKAGYRGDTVAVIVKGADEVKND